MAALPPSAQAALRQAIAAGFMPLDGNGVPDLTLVQRLCSTPSTGSTGGLAAAAAPTALPAPAAAAAPGAAAPLANQLLTASKTFAAAAPSVLSLPAQLLQPSEPAPASSSVAGGMPQPSAAPAAAPATSAADSAESRPPLAMQPSPDTTPVAASRAAAATPSDPAALLPPPHALAQLVPAAAAATAAAAAAGRAAPPADDARMKSRAIQARYRQRQKERRLQLVHSYQETTAELDEARRLNAELRLASQIMEAVVSSREGSLAVLQAARAESDGGSSDESGGEDAGRRCRALAALPAPGAAALALPAAAPGQLNRQTAADLVRNLLSLPFDRRAELCCDILVRHEPSRQTVESWALAHTEQHLGGCEDMEMRLRQELGRHLQDASPQLLEAVLNMSQRQLLEDWADFTDVAAQAVAALDAGLVPEQDVCERIRPGYLYHVMINSLLINNRPEWCRWRLSHTMLPGESEAQAAARWHHVAVKMGISHAQALRIQRAYQDYCARLSELAAESATALDALAEAKQALAGEQLLDLDAPLGVSMSRHLALVEATGALARQPNEAVITLLEFTASLTRALTPIQRARMVALSKPLLPDFVLIAIGTMRQHGLLPRALTSAAAACERASLVPVAHPLATRA